MKLVFDCNVLVNALLSNNSDSGKSLPWAKSEAHTVLVSNGVLAELIEVLMRKKFDKYATAEIRQLFFEEYFSLGTLLKPNREVTICRDPKDNMYLELALSGKADCIITNDDDLLVLNPFENIAIISPKEFLERHS